MKTVEFLEALVPSDGIMFSAVPASFEKNNKTINYYKHTTCYDHHQLALACKVASKSQTNSFFALASFHQESYEDPSTGKKKQRTQENAKSLKCTWLDIDCGPGIALVQKAIGKKEGFRIHPSSMHNPEAHARPLRFDVDGS